MISHTHQKGSLYKQMIFELLKRAGAGGQRTKWYRRFSYILGYWVDALSDHKRELPKTQNLSHCSIFAMWCWLFTCHLNPMQSYSCLHLWDRISWSSQQYFTGGDWCPHHQSSHFLSFYFKDIWIFIGPRCLWGPIFGFASLKLTHSLTIPFWNLTDVTLTDEDTNSILNW